MIFFRKTVKALFLHINGTSVLQFTLVAFFCDCLVIEFHGVGTF